MPSRSAHTSASAPSSHCRAGSPPAPTGRTLPAARRVPCSTPVQPVSASPDMAQASSGYLAGLERAKLASPRVFLFRMLVFLTLCALLVVVLNKQIWQAFLANPGLNALIVLVLLIGIVFAFQQVIRLY